MSVTRAAVRRLYAEEAGAILAFWALFAGLVLFMMASFVVDVGNWYTHKRQLQLRVDSGALAASGFFSTCFASPAQGNTDISNIARDYAGSPDATGTPYNNEFPNQENVHILINSTDFWNHGGADNTDPNGAPCAAGYVDVKGTDSQIPWFFRFAETMFDMSPTTVNADARVKIFQAESRKGNLPVAVPDPGRVTAAQVEFINEATNTIVGTTPLLTKGSPSGGKIPFTGVASSVAVTGVESLGVRVKLSGQDPPPTSITCGQTLVECYDAGTGAATGVLLIHGFPSGGKVDAGGAGAPAVRGARLINSTCSAPDAYFFFMSPGKNDTCRIGVQADIVGAVNEVRATLTPPVESGAATLTERLSNTSGTNWQSTGTGQFKYVDVVNDAGPYNVTLSWSKTSGTVGTKTCGNGNGSNPPPCTGSWGGFVFQRSFSATDPRSGPLRTVRVWETGGAPPFATFQNDATAKSLSVLIEIPVGISNVTGPTAPAVALKVSNESLGQAIDCDPDVPNLRREIVEGCAPAYKINTTGVCAPHNVLWDLEQPWDCAKTAQGGAGGQVEQGMTERILQGETCNDHPNNFGLYPNLPANDTRIVPVMLTSFGAFSGSGQTTVPITNFATFYVTGWAKATGGKAAGAYCKGDDVPPAKGWILGRFIKYIDPSSSGGGSVDCDLNALGSCVAILVK